MFRPLAVAFTIDDDYLSTEAIQDLFLAFRDGKAEIVAKDGKFIGWTEDEDLVKTLIMLDMERLVQINANYPTLYTDDGTAKTFDDFRHMDPEEIRALLFTCPDIPETEGEPDDTEC